MRFLLVREYPGVVDFGEADFPGFKKQKKIEL
jgi:hypothetical protein